MKATSAVDCQNILERLDKTYNTCTARIKTCELYVNDKLGHTKNHLKQIEQTLNSFATLPMIAKVNETEKANKVNFQVELERF